MATIEVFYAPNTCAYYCLFCGFDMTSTGICTDCNEYKSAVTLEEYVEHNGHYPRLRAVK